MTGLFECKMQNDKYRKEHNMNKQELTNLVAEILSQMNGTQPQVKGSAYHPTAPQPPGVVKK